MIDTIDIIYVEDRADDIFIVETLVKHNTSWKIHVARTFLEAFALAEEMLDRGTPWHPIVFIVDVELALPIKLNESKPFGPDGISIIAELRQSMLNEIIHPCYLIAMSHAMTTSRREDALRAGAHDVWNKPMTLNHLKMIQELASQPPIRPIAAKINDNVESPAPPSQEPQKPTGLKRIIQSLLASLSPQRIWTAEDLRLLLGASSDAIRLTQDETQQAMRLITELGGSARATARLRSLQHVLNDEQQEILRRLLRREQKGEIQDYMPIGRTRLENEIKAICQALAIEFSTTNHSI